MIHKYGTFDLSAVHDSLKEDHCLPNKNVDITRTDAIYEDQTIMLHNIKQKSETKISLFKIMNTSLTIDDSKSIVDGVQQSKKELVQLTYSQNEVITKLISNQSEPTVSIRGYESEHSKIKNIQSTIDKNKSIGGLDSSIEKQ